VISPAILGLDDRHALSSPAQADCQGFTLCDIEPPVLPDPIEQDENSTEDV
jgi:hypothetical protein